MVQWHENLFAAADPSVGLYLYIAHLWLHGGNLPYLRVWEYKPPGLFAYVALALKLSGDRPSLAIHSLTTLSAIVTALLLWRFTAACDPRGGDLAGRFAALFSVLTSTENEGYLGDSEILAQPFVVAAFLFARLGGTRVEIAALAGLSAGIALQMKLSLLPIVLVPAIVLLRGRRSRCVAAYAAGFALPVLWDVAVYTQGGALAALVDANVGATVRRVAGLHGGIERENLPWLAAELRILAPALELAFFALSRRANADRLATWGWLAAALVSIAGIGEFYDRQFVLCEAPVAVLGGLGLRSCLYSFAGTRRLAAASVVLTFLLTFALHDYWETTQALRIAYHRSVLGERNYKLDDYTVISQRLENLPAASRSLYVLEVTPMLYAATGAASPTRFPFSDHLLDRRMTSMIGISGRAELARIFATHPAIVATGHLHDARFDPLAVDLVESRLHRDYRRIAEHPYNVYRAVAPVVYPNRPK